VQLWQCIGRVSSCTSPRHVTESTASPSTPAVTGVRLPSGPDVDGLERPRPAPRCCTRRAAAASALACSCPSTGCTTDCTSPTTTRYARPSHLPVAMATAPRRCLYCLRGFTYVRLAGLHLQNALLSLRTSCLYKLTQHTTLLCRLVGKMGCRWKALKTYSTGPRAEP